MKDYWDSSAVIEACHSPALRDRLHRERGLTRVHTLAEVFSTLTGGNLAFRLGADEAAKTVANLALDLDFQDLAATDVLKALKESRKKGVRGRGEKSSALANTSRSVPLLDNLLSASAKREEGSIAREACANVAATHW